MATGDLIVCSNSLIYFLIFLPGPVVTGGERGLTAPHRTDTRRPRVSEANGVSKYVLIDDVHVHKLFVTFNHLCSFFNCNYTMFKFK